MSKVQLYVAPLNSGKTAMTVGRDYTAVELDTAGTAAWVGDSGDLGKVVRLRATSSDSFVSFSEADVTPSATTGIRLDEGERESFIIGSDALRIEIAAVA